VPVIRGGIGPAGRRQKTRSVRKHPFTASSFSLAPSNVANGEGTGAGSRGADAARARRTFPADYLWQFDGKRQIPGLFIALCYKPEHASIWVICQH
ncbi:MAG: hypothetical protein QXI12_13430, partial [Candidatus Methanomethyliaceae archaeon]